MSKKGCVFIGLLLIFSLVLVSNLKLYSDIPRKSTFASDDFLIINHDAGDADYSDIAINENGDGVIVWQHRSKDWDIYAQLIKNEEKVGDVIKINRYTLSNQQFPKVDIDEKGNFVVAWQSYLNGGCGSDIYAQRFDADGRRLRNEFRVHSDTKHNQMSPDVVMDDNGSFAVVWVSESPVMKKAVTTYYKNIFIKFFDADGIQQTDEIQVNFNEFELNTEPSVAINNFGDTMVAWQANNNGNWDIYSQLFDKDGEKKSAINTLIYFDAENDQIKPSVAATSSDGFIIAWSNKHPHEMFERVMENIKAQAITKSGSKSGIAFDVNEPELYKRHANPSITSSGDFTAVVWQSYEDGHWNLMCQYLDKQNKLLGKGKELTDSFKDEVWDLNASALLTDDKLNVSWTQLDLNANRKNVVYKQDKIELNLKSEM